MGNAISSAAALTLYTAISAIELIKHLDPQPGSTAAATQAAALGGAVRAIVPLATAVGGLFASVGLIHRHVHRAGAGAGNRRLSELVGFMLCASAGSLLLLLVPAPGGVDHGGAGREVGLAALRAIPAVATATFFLGIMLIIVGHIRAGGEGGGGDIAPIEGGVALLAKMAAATLVCLIAMAAYFMSRLGGSSSI